MRTRNQDTQRLCCPHCAGDGNDWIWDGIDETRILCTACSGAGWVWVIHCHTNPTICLPSDSEVLDDPHEHLWWNSFEELENHFDLREARRVLRDIHRAEQETHIPTVCR